MSVDISVFAVGDTDYVSKLNNNCSALKLAVESLQSVLTGSVSSQVGFGSLLSGLFGTTPVIIGLSSYVVTPSGTDLSISAGAGWKPSLLAVVRSAAVATLSFAGQAAATYYVVIDSFGIPSRSESSTDALYSVVWTGSTFGAITLLANYFFTATEQTALLTSSHFSTVYSSLAARLNAIEAAL